MPKKITLKLTNVRYGGQSIGNDVRVEVDVFGNTVAYDAKLKRGESIQPKLELGSTPVEKKPFEISATIRVIERDVLFPDQGQATAQIKVDPSASFPQSFTHMIAVRESRGFVTKRTARFEITIEAHIPKRIPTVDDPKWTGNFHDDPIQMILARAIFGEGRSLPEQGRIAIGWVVRNRIGYSQWGIAYHDVILHPSHFSAFNKTDRNRKLVEDPSSDLTQRNAWNQCYDLASGILSGSIPDPTKGANHYYSTFIKPPDWAHSKGAVLTLRVENTIFYRLPVRSKVFLPVIFFGASLLATGFYTFAQVNRVPSLGYLDEVKRLYSYESIADHSIAVYYGCGTECEGVRIFDETTGKQRASFNYGVGYLWSANKKYVAAFHMAAGHGVTIGDMFGNELFVYTKPLEKSFDIPSVAAWAPNDSRLAVLLNEDGQQELFIIFGFESGNTTRVTSVHVPSAEKYAIEWDATGRRVQVNGGAAVLDIDDSGYGHQYTRYGG